MLKNLLLFAAILFFIKSVPVYPQQDRWRKIKPIESKLSDVEAILGKAEKTEHRVTYALDEGVYSILYSYGPCELEMDWKVPEWTVIEVFYRPYDDLKLSILGI
ncbi:MAG TPA: hypothetical protein VK400_02055, partial [Pyrinomonadaceae bacterium]|nr:hypothetical protein [Pyrinomonadaceae bacterium]